MIPNLPRPFLWTEIKTMKEFLNGDLLASPFYGTFKEIQGSIFLSYVDEVALFNEFYYQLTRYYYEQPKESDYQRYYADIRTNLGKVECADLVMTMMFHYCRIREICPRFRITPFMRAIILQQEKNVFWQSFMMITSTMGNWFDFVPYPQKPCPVDPGELRKKGLNWKRITHEFNLDTLKEIINLWDKEDEKRTIASIMMKYVLTIKEYNSEKVKNAVKYLTQVMNGQDNNHDEKTFSANIVELDGPVMFNSEYNKSKESEKELLQLKNDIKNYRQRIERLEAKNSQIREERDTNKKKVDELEKKVKELEEQHEEDEARLAERIANASPENAFNAQTGVSCFTSRQMGILLTAVGILTEKENPPAKTTLGEVVEKIAGYKATTVNQNMKGKFSEKDKQVIMTALKDKLPNLAEKVSKL